MTNIYLFSGQETVNKNELHANQSLKSLKLGGSFLCADGPRFFFKGSCNLLLLSEYDSWKAYYGTVFSQSLRLKAT